MRPLDVVKNRWLGFLIWQSIAGTAAYLLILFLRPPTSFPIFSLCLLLLLFSLSILLFSLSLFLLASPHPESFASIPELAAVLLKLSLKSVAGGFVETLPSPDSRRRARRSLDSLLFVAICCASGFLSVVSVFWGPMLIGLGLRGLVFGLMYGIQVVFGRRWILRFPIVQRPLFYSFKMGVVSSLKQALNLSTLAFFCSMLLMQGSAAAETNPSEMLIDALEQSNPRSLVQYLAYLDLCMVTESNVESWRRAAFFEETGETYRRVVSACLRPLKQLTSSLAERLEGFSVDKSILSQQLNSPVDSYADPMLHESFNDFQICAWCARAIGAVTARSNYEDRYGVAQLTGSNKAVVSTLLSCLLAVEASMGKNTNPQPAHLMSPDGIRWATASTPGRGVSVISTKVGERGGTVHGEAYAMADVIRTSLYGITTVFQSDMQANAKVLEKNWIIDEKPLYGTREALVQKLGFFLEFRGV